MEHIENMKKICLISSSGGHLNELMILKKLNIDGEKYIITEKTPYKIEDSHNVFYIKQVNRREKTFLINMTIVTIQSTYLYIKKNPDVVISTGALAAIPTCILAKIFRKKIIFIESFANVSSPTLTGKFVYKFADVFIVQWEDLKKYYPNAIFLGSIY